jgi:2-desacetyl-2-hydroxyethyl bacteriochlorophyllide A dehydrogenase
MKAAVLTNDRTLHFGDAPEPKIRPGEVLVRTSSAGICGTDLHVYRGEFHGRVRFPAILGHEFGGVIQEVGPDVRGFAVGDRVAVDPILPCHACPACLEGHINCCATLKLLGLDLDGGFGEFVAVPQANLYRLPDNVAMKVVPMVEMYGLGHHVLERGHVQPGETVAILGAGKLGLSVLDVLCHGAGAAFTVVCDQAPFRLETARVLGADHVVDIRHDDPVERVRELTQGVGVDCVIECVGHAHEISGREPPLAQAVKMIRHGGRVVTAGLGDQLTPVHFKTLVMKEGAIIATRVTAGEFPRALRLLAKGLLHPQRLITHEMPMQDAAAAFKLVDSENPGVIKVVLNQILVSA